MKSPLSFFIFLISFFIFLLSCKRTTEPLSAVDRLQLNVLDVSCTEAWLGLTVNPKYYGKTLTLYRNDSLIESKTVTSTDTLLYDRGLKPYTSYTYTAKVFDGQRMLSESPKATAVTLDTTSHNFTWQTWEFGGVNGSSYFKDVAIIDENDIWAVGEIHTKDTDHWNEDSTKWLQPYNAAHWDGEKWKLIRIANDGYPRRIVYAFGKNDVWFDGSIKWDGVSYSVHMKNFPLMPNGDGWYRNAMWGISSEDFYVVGDHGMIAHYNGQEWTRIESGTNENIQDIWGVIDKETGKPYILCAASQVLVQSEKRILNIQPDNTVQNDNWPFNDRKPYSVWFKNRKRIFACGDGLFDRELKGNWRLLYDEIPYFMNRIRGSDINNIYVVGAFGLIAHYNGINWKTLPTKLYGSYVAVDIKENLVVTVGYENRPALLTMIRKQN